MRKIKSYKNKKSIFTKIKERIRTDILYYLYYDFVNDVLTNNDEYIFVSLYKKWSLFPKLFIKYKIIDDRNTDKEIIKEGLIKEGKRGYIF